MAVALETFSIQGDVSGIPFVGNFHLNLEARVSYTAQLLLSNPIVPP